MRLNTYTTLPNNDKKAVVVRQRGPMHFNAEDCIRNTFQTWVKNCSAAPLPFVKAISGGAAARQGSSSQISFVLNVVYTQWGVDN